MDGIKNEGIRDSHAFFIETSSSIAEIISTNSSKENRSIVKRMHYACDVCSFPCRTKGNLRKHMQLHKNACRICNELFVTTEKLELHMVVQHGEPKYTCKLCYSVLWNKPDMKKHFLVSHLLVDPFCNTCTACNKMFQSKYALERHMYSQHTKLSVACTVCRRVYNSFHALKAHTKLIHLKTGYQCEICKRRLLSTDSLEAHLQRHEGSRNIDSYICTTCGETFLTKNKLNKHVIIHGEVNPYVCPVCQKAFEKRANQVQHILTHMNNVYACDICGLRYSRRAALIWHRKMHPGPLGKLPVIPVIGIVSEFVKNYISKTKNLPNS